jgi:hypothetical protein
MLTSSDLEILYKDKDYEKEVTAQMRYRLRQRVRNGIIDFALLNASIPDTERNQIFAPQSDSLDNLEFYEGLMNMISFAYSGCVENGLSFSDFLTSAIKNSEADRYDGTISVDVDFDVEVSEQYDVKDALDRFEAGEELTFEEIGVLLGESLGGSDKHIERLREYSRGRRSELLTTSEQTLPPLSAIPGRLSESDLKDNAHTRNIARHSRTDYTYDLSQQWDGPVDIKFAPQTPIDEERDDDEVDEGVED